MSFSLLDLAQDTDVGRLGEEEALAQAKTGLGQMASSSVVGTFLRADDMAARAVDDAESFVGTWESVLNKLVIFTEVTNLMSEVRSPARGCHLTAQILLRI